MMKRCRSLLGGLAVLLAASAALAHGNMPPYIAFWGPFDAAATHCQRMLGLAGQRCVGAVLALPRTCENCSADELAAVQETKINDGETQIRSACNDDTTVKLGFRGLDEALSDLRRTCTNEPASVSQLIADAASESDTARCVERKRAIGVMLLEDATRVKRGALDVIATRQLEPSQRLARLNRVTVRLAKMRRRMDDLLAQECVSPPPATFLVLIELRAECVVNGAYYQSAYQCPR